MTELSCVYQDEHVYAIQKPAGIPFHYVSKTGSESLDEEGEEGIISQVKQFLNDPKIYPVHRLDKMTSGLMLFARHEQANRALSMAFEAKSIEKYYLALSKHKPKKKQGAIIGDMSKARSGSYKLNRTTQNPAITRFFAQKIILQEDEPVWMFALKPETGKTHQLRVALKSLGSPIWGDRRYAGEPASRGYLHAYAMRFYLFDQGYSLVAPDFMGDEFALGSPTVQSQLQAGMNFLKPEALAWPKSAYKLTI